MTTNMLTEVGDMELQHTKIIVWMTDITSVKFYLEQVVKRLHWHRQSYLFLLLKSVCS